MSHIEEYTQLRSQTHTAQVTVRGIYLQLWSHVQEYTHNSGYIEEYTYSSGFT